MERFDTLEEAQSYVSNIIDKPCQASVEAVKHGVSLTKSTIELDNGKFTNSYDISFSGLNLQADIVAFDTLTTAYEFSNSARQYAAVTSGGFFYLADHGSGSPRQLALNLSISRGNLRSLPVVDRESVMAGHGGLKVRLLAALGSLSLNGHELEWSGSLTDYDTEVKVYGNGNVKINHDQNSITGSVRVLDETSRFTPEIDDCEVVDLGFIGRGSNNFIGVQGSAHGGLDIFAHDFILRCPQRYIKGNTELIINTVGGIALSRFEGGAFSAGPSLNIADFQNHPINRDASLGTRPPFSDIRLARTVIYKSEDGLTHIRLFDGRPDSPIFPGVTPAETVSHIRSEGVIEWGCFLDPGQTAKLCVNLEERHESFGNRHYLQWPNENSPDFLWIPEVGRPISNVLAIK